MAAPREFRHPSVYRLGPTGNGITSKAFSAGAVARLICGLLILRLLSAPVLGQVPAGTATAGAASQGDAFVQWNLQLVGGGPTSWIQVQHCSAGVTACTDPSASPNLFQTSVTLTNCDVAPGCPSYADDTQLTASTTYVDKVTLFPTTSNTTGQITSVLTPPYTTRAFPVPSITSFQAMSGSSVLLTTNEPDQYYWGLHVYGCPGTGCTNFTSLGDMCAANHSMRDRMMP